MPVSRGSFASTFAERMQVARADFRPCCRHAGPLRGKRMTTGSGDRWCDSGHAKRVAVEDARLMTFLSTSRTLLNSAPSATSPQQPQAEPYLCDISTPRQEAPPAGCRRCRRGGWRRPAARSLTQRRGGPAPPPPPWSPPPAPPPPRAASPQPRTAPCAAAAAAGVASGDSGDSWFDKVAWCCQKAGAEPASALCWLEA